MLKALLRVYAGSPLALTIDSWPEKVFRRAVWAVDFLENVLAFQASRLRLTLRRAKNVPLDKDKQESDTTLLAVYSLKTSGLTFDFVTFLGIVEMERQRRGLFKSRVIVYAPPEFPIYQWQRLKIFNNMGGKPLIRAERKHVLAYVRKLTDAARIFSTTMRCEVVGRRRELLTKASAYSNVFPPFSAWTGEFQNMTEYKVYSELKHGFHESRDAVTRYQCPRLRAWWIGRIGGGKLVATMNFRNQGYSGGRNSNVEHWKAFFSEPFIRNNFHFIVFNDAEHPVAVDDATCITFCDRYIHDNFRRFKAILGVGLHIGNDSGSSSIVAYSDVPYLQRGVLDWRDRAPHLDPIRYSMEDDLLLYDRDKRYQLFSFRTGPIMDDVHVLLKSIAMCQHVLERYPESFREKLIEVLRDWPCDAAGVKH